MKVSKFFLVLVLSICSLNLYSQDEPKFEIIIKEVDTTIKKDNLIDINHATREEMLSKGIPTTIVNKILSFRDKTGCFEDIHELKKISGIGEATFLKVNKKFKIEGEISKKPLYINKANLELLKYYGFTLKEIKEIEKFRNKKSINNNIDLKEILSESKYKKLKDNIRYDR